MSTPREQTDGSPVLEITNWAKELQRTILKFQVTKVNNVTTALNSVPDDGDDGDDVHDVAPVAEEGEGRLGPLGAEDGQDGLGYGAEGVPYHALKIGFLVNGTIDHTSFYQ